MKTNQRPLIGVTLGDVAGIGPEVLVKALQRTETLQACRILVIGDARVFTDPKFSALCSPAQTITRIPENTDVLDGITLYDMHNLDTERIQIGQVSALAGKAAVIYVIKAAELALQGRIHAIATAPLNKEAIQIAGYHYIG
ncbi:MAG: 4-hydroxythreonine-4-phosphate dehydrogenase PdxA, partial [Anaerolineae bacterium]|nr:4-hydroxythreonine-4-phosphate dehydrogenase PdxA [Anaerolineae bacterium]